MKFWLGTHKVAQHWWDAGVPLFVSRRTLTGRRTLPRARAEWALDSGGFTELNLYGEWRTSEDEFVADVLRFQDEVGELAWTAPMDWMCEPFVLRKTGKDVRMHQLLTVQNFLRLRDRLGQLVIPVLQGWTRDEYLWCVGEYDHWGVDLWSEPLVGLGTVCRRQNMVEAARIVRSLSGLRLHGFGVKIEGLAVYADALASADSMAWSYRARRSHPLPGCRHAKCTNCAIFAMRWRDRIVSELLAQTRLEVA